MKICRPERECVCVCEREREREREREKEKERERKKKNSKKIMVVKEQRFLSQDILSEMNSTNNESPIVIAKVNCSF